MYEVGDHIKLTDDLILPVSPFHMYKIQKHSELTITEINSQACYYKVRLHKGNSIMRVPFRIKNISAKVIIENLTESTNRNHYTTILHHGLSFGSAMTHLEAGYKITRKIWSGYWKKQNIYTDGNSGTRYKEAIVAQLKDGGWAVASPYQEDMLANDWMVVK